MSGFDQNIPRESEDHTPRASYAPDKHGRVADTIGTGDHAKTGLVYVSIMWCFIGAGTLSLFVILNLWFFRQNEKVPDIAEDLRFVWSIFTPIITLALGYAFGRSQK